MSIIQVKGSDVKDVPNVPSVLSVPDGTFVPGGGDRATVETDLSTPSAPSGRDVPSERGLIPPLCRTTHCQVSQQGLTPTTRTSYIAYSQALRFCPDGVNAINSPEAVVSNQAGSNEAFESLAHDSDFIYSSTGTSRHLLSSLIYQALTKAGLRKKADYFRDCGQIVYTMICERCGYEKPVTHHCKLRICPRCSWVKKKILVEKYLPYIKHLEKHIRELRAGMRGRLPQIGLRHVTLTLKNVADLEAGVDRIRIAFTKLRHQNYYKARIIGGIYGIEAPLGRDKLWNIHLHLLYYGYYIPQGKLSDDWEALTGDSRVTYVQYVYSVEDALDYILKYVTKGIQLDGEADVDKMVEFVVALEDVRLVQAFGCFLGKIEQPEPLICPKCGWRMWRMVLRTDDGVRVVFSQLNQIRWVCGIRSP